jgi:asparagine synthase (glutamine-hydrolysing)
VCGLNGYFSKIGRMPLSQALAQLAHRGPDAAAEWETRTRNGNHLGLGHARLSIVDLSESANQPFTSSCGRYRMVYNGEIYNYRAIRTELQALGVSFRTASDSEVLLNAYIQWREQCLSKLDGIFAFAIYDDQAETLFLARDQFGIKPLCYAYDAARGTFAFASEFRALAVQAATTLEPDESCFVEFFLNGWLYEPNTGLKGLHKLPPGHFADLDCNNGVLRIQAYYDPLEPQPQADIAELLHEAMALQSTADVPVGLFFSGGLDSTALAAAYPGKLNALLMEYEEPGGIESLDTKYALAIAKALDMPLERRFHRPESSSADSIIENFRAVARGTEEPISDYTYIASRELSAAARASGFKVMLSGMAGDELYAGYPRHKLAAYDRYLRLLAPAGSLAGALLANSPRYAKKAQRLAGYLSHDEFVQRYTRLVGYFSMDEAQALTGRRDEGYWQRLSTLAAPVRDQTPLKRALYLDRYGYLSHNLTVTDRSSMAQSIEVRVPLLTPRQAAWAFHAPDRTLVDWSHSKKPLRNFVYSRVERSLIDRPKVGFNPPLDGKIAALGRSRILSELSAGPARDHLDMKWIEAMVANHFEGRSNETYRLWQVLYFNYWLDEMRAFNARNRAPAESLA